jgi:hypothetical protein
MFFGSGNGRHFKLTVSPGYKIAESRVARHKGHEVMAGIMPRLAGRACPQNRGQPPRFLPARHFEHVSRPLQKCHA